MKYVYILHHVRVHNEDEVKLIGVYSSESEAQAAIERLSTKPGFASEIEGFTIERFEINQDEWREGFVTFSRIWVKVKEAGSLDSPVLVRCTMLADDVYELLDVDPGKENIPLEFPLGSHVRAKKTLLQGKEVWMADTLIL